MKMTMHPDMIEATRLTRDGHLTEATALLQRMLQSGIEPDARTDGPRAAADTPPLGATHIVELTPDMIEAPSARQSSSTGRIGTRFGRQSGGQYKQPSPPRMPGRLRGFIENASRIGVTLRGTNAKLRSSRRRTPRACYQKAASSFTATFTDQAGTRDLQTVHSQYLPRTTAAAGRHAARLHTVSRRFRRRHAHEHGG